MSQNELILKALKKGQKITAIDALSEFGCFRLSARIKNLKDMGHNIAMEMVRSSNGKRFAQYYMPRKKRG